MKRTFRQVVNDGWKILREDIYGVRGVIIALALYFLFFGISCEAFARWSW